VDFHCIEVEEC